MSGFENSNPATPVSQPAPIRSQTSEMRIGKVTYIVNTIFNENGRETAEQKLARYVADRILNDYLSLPSGETQE